MKKLLAIISIILIAFFFVFGVYNYRGKHSNFRFDGYVIDTKTNNKQYFSDNGEYKIYDSSNSVTFTNSDNETQSVSNDTFIHYLDGSISAFKKTAVVSLSNMKQKSFQYYTVYPGVIFSKREIDYKIPYLDKQLTFNEFLIKISPNKYMILSPKLKIKVGDDVTQVTSGFIELTYSDGNIVKLQNQEIDIQNISSDIQISINDNTYINVANKKIYYKDTEKINLGEITIDSNDNIEIIEDEDNTVIDEKKETEKKNEKNNDNNGNNNNGNNGESNSGKKIIHQGDFEEVLSGVVDAAEIEIETVVEENAAIKDATFTITDFNVTANSVNAEVAVTDEAAVLKGTLYIKVVKASTNEVVYYEQDNSGSNNIQVEVLTLSPETNYVLVMNRDYEKNGITYNKDFVQKTFVTSSLGINVKKDYVRTDEINLNVLKKNYSKVNKVSYKLVDNTTKDEISEGDVEFENDFEKVLNFGGLNSNHNYTLTLHDFVYGNTLINASSSNYYYTFNTLKVKPVITNTSFSVDKKNSKFVVYLNNIKDIDSGIKSYRADVYDASNNNYITSKTTSTNEKIEFGIDGTLITRNTNYRVYTYLVFDDNAMEYEIPIGSQEVNVTGFAGPIVTFYPGTITWDSIGGTIEVVDDNETVNRSEQMFVSYQNLTVGAEAITIPCDVSFANDKAIIAIDEHGLRGNDSYLFTVKAQVNYHDGNGYSLVDISQFIVNTPKPNNMAVMYQDKTSEHKSDSFYVNAKLIDYDENKPASAEASAMYSIMFKLYSVDYDPATECVPANKCWTKRYYDQNVDDNNNYNSSLKADYYDTDFKITQATLGADTSEISYGQYKLEILGAYDYTVYKNELPIIMEEPIEISANNAAGFITNRTTPVDVIPIYNNDTYEFLDETTQIGFRVTANILANVRVDRVTYEIYDADNDDESLEDVTVDSPNGTVPSAVFNISNSQEDPIARGKSYYFKYKIYYTADLESGEEESTNSEAFITKKQQADFEIYQSDRTESNVIFKYKYRDIDKSVVNSKFYYYRNSTNNNYSSLDLTETDSNEEHTLSIPFTNGTLHGYIERKLQVNGNKEKIELVNYYFSDLTGDIGSIQYEIVDGQNMSSISFPNLSSVQLRNIVGMDVTLSNGVANKTLENLVLDSDNKINILYADIKNLKSPNTSDLRPITASVTVYYDTGVYGVNATNLGHGFAVQFTNYSYMVRSKIFAFNISEFNPFNNALTLQSIKNSSTTYSYTYDLSNGYIVFDEDKVNLKQLDTTGASCSTNCSFSFTEILPTMTIDSTSSGITTARVSGSVSGIDNSYLENFKIVGELYSCSNSACSTMNQIRTVTSTLDDFNNNGMLIGGLSPNAYYALYYKWTTNDGETTNNFYFSNTGDQVYRSVFHTTNNIGINGVYATYTANSFYNKRNLVISYLVSILEGYTGVNYDIYTLDVDGETHIPVPDFEIPSDTLADLQAGTSGGRYSKVVDISGALEAGKVYYIDIKPYYGSPGSPAYLVSKNGVKFNFIIRDPAITVSRTSDIAENKFNIRVLFKDLYNALLGGDTYELYYVSGGVKTLKGEGEVGDTQSFEDITCTGTSCEIIIEYQADFDNDGVTELASYSYTVSLLNNIYIGNASIASISDTTKIRISFTDSYKLTDVNKLSYTIYDSEWNTSANNDDFTPIWGTSGSTVYTDVPVNLENGTYTIQLQLYYDGELVGNATLDYIKG